MKHTHIRQSIISILFALIALTAPVQADHQLKPRLFYSFESNHMDQIQGIGLEYIAVNKPTNLGIGLTSSINVAEVISQSGYTENYMAIEASLKVGYFSDVSLFAEIGYDLGEDFIYDDKEDDHYNHDYHQHNRIDSYLGIGIGIKLNKVTLESFARYRNIDSDYWHAENSAFYGLRISIEL